jgi:hypothetical protein
MRDSLAGPSTDRMSSAASWLAWGLAGAFFTLVALPLASSSPYPTPSRQDWSIPNAQATSASSFALASASSVAVQGELVPLVTTVKTLSIKRPIGSEAELDPSRVILATNVGSRSTEDPVEERKVTPVAPADPELTPDEANDKPSMAEVDAYLWSVYERQPVKKDAGGDFSWKDPAAAKRMGKTLESYVIMGMDADFRELVYHLGKAMDAAGIEWQIVSAFRDDWRQSIASGVKARTGYSRHGGSLAVGGYGHGRAVDVGHVDRERNEEVWNWIDANGAKYGLYRPFRSFDPPHVEARLDWRRVASNLRHERTGIEVAEDATTTGTIDRRDAMADARPAKRVAQARPVRQKARVAASNRRTAASNRRIAVRSTNSRSARVRVTTVKSRQGVTAQVRSAKRQDKRRRIAGG